ncbi:L-threonylcarbamoyladenylate synthase [Roseitranquillus sediminis]|uniref:L-threonylcarbamoyladenylate synthase n=1 Tax=Roseitranquillus sediminis TaxID=2809051 RepID=UPI001D0C1A69|nr:L-threonylcarbamoyladenylate synthase [Roseitranquillus sediminis]MBM9593335.1 threonylcarbamoyl-AMP synthase [Roseitranquillus sediminis]
MVATELLPPDGDGPARAGELLRSGALVAFPTETVYGLGADATQDEAVARIYEAKARPRFNPLIVHVPDLAAARRIAEFDDVAERLAAAFWPGPLTLVLPARAETVSALTRAGLETVAVRVPAHPVAQAVLRAAKRPLAAPSANPSGRVSPTEVAHVLAGLGGRISAVVEGGRCTVGVESTIVGLAGRPRLLRPGGLPAEEVEACLGRPLATHEGGIVAPGQIASHYAPRGRLRLDAARAEPGEVLLGFGLVEADLNLSRSGDLTEAAARLFGCLHELDRHGVERIAVSPIPERGLGRAINDRLRRAAAPRQA